MNKLEQVLGDLALYRQPQLLKPEFAAKLQTENTNKQDLDKYFELLTAIEHFFKKALAYELYFSDFYPCNSTIAHFEALEHHIHAYLEDSIILKNKLEVFLGQLKNDLKRVAINKKEIEKALNFLIDQINTVFKKLSDIRDPHHHRGMKFLDPDLIDARMANMVLSNQHLLSKYLLPEAVEQLKKKELGSFEKAKERWVKTAKNNKEQMAGLVNDIIGRVEGFLYDYLKIEHTSDLFNQTQKDT